MLAVTFEEKNCFSDQIKVYVSVYIVTVYDNEKGDNL